MKGPELDILGSSLTQLYITWVPLVQGSDTGGISLDSYIVYYKQETSSLWLQTTSHTLGYTILDMSLVQGSFYLMKIVAVNKYGQGPDSATLRAITGQRPDPSLYAPSVQLQAS